MDLQSKYIILLVAIVAAATTILRSPWFKGVLGEFWVNSSLSKRLDEDQYQLFKNLTLPSRDGTTQIDHVVMSRFGIFVIETKNMSGWIFGNENQARWTQVIYRKKTKFQNPLRQNYKHVKTVQDLLGISADKLYNIVVFVGSGVPKTPMPSNVVWSTGSLLETIKSKRVELFDQDELTGFAERLAEARHRSGIQTHRAHVRHVKSQVALRQSDANCPRCGAELVERTNRKSGARFLSCSRFPKCRGTRQQPNPS